MSRHQVEVRRDESRAAVHRFEARARSLANWGVGAALVGVAAEWAGLLPPGARGALVGLAVASGAGYAVTHLTGLWRWATGRPALAQDELALVVGEPLAPRPERPPMWRTRIAAAAVAAYGIALHVLRSPLERYVGDPIVGVEFVAVWGALALGVLAALDARALASDRRVSRRGIAAAWLGAAAGVAFCVGAQSILPRAIGVWVLGGAFAVGIAALVCWELERSWHGRHAARKLFQPSRL